MRKRNFQKGRGQPHEAVGGDDRDIVNEGKKENVEGEEESDSDDHEDECDGDDDSTSGSVDIDDETSRRHYQQLFNLSEADVKINDMAIRSPRSFALDPDKAEMSFITMIDKAMQEYTPVRVKYGKGEGNAEKKDGEGSNGEEKEGENGV